MHSRLRSTIFIGFAALGLGSTSYAQETATTDGHVKKPYTVKLTMTPPESRHCQAQLHISYLQKNDVASVESTLNNEDCSSSSGSYIVSVRIRDENNETSNIEYDETWQREDSQPIVIRKEYFAGENLDIIRVRTKKLRCTCTDEVPQDEKLIVE